MMKIQRRVNSVHQIISFWSNRMRHVCLFVGSSTHTHTNENMLFKVNNDFDTFYKYIYFHACRLFVRLCWHERIHNIRSHRIAINFPYFLLLHLTIKYFGKIFGVSPVVADNFQLKTILIIQCI